MGFLFLVVHSRLLPPPLPAVRRRPPAARPLITYNLSTHNLLTHNLTTQLDHKQLAHTQLVHTQLTHTQLTHTQLDHTQLAHTQLDHTQLAHTTYSHTTWPQASCSHNLLTHNLTTLNWVTLQMAGLLVNVINHQIWRYLIFRQTHLPLARVYFLLRFWLLSAMASLSILASLWNFPSLHPFGNQVLGQTADSPIVPGDVQIYAH